jgi:division protein CdvB (Snf7/Vps24/ESCRT-III family)
LVLYLDADSQMVKMSGNFAERWETNKQEKSYSDELRETIVPVKPLKPRIELAIKALETQTTKLNQANERLIQKDKVLFAKLVDAYSKHDQTHANMYASELVEVRKMTKILLNSKLALDQVSLRIKSISELGDVISAFGSCMAVLQVVGKRLSGVIPEAEAELGSVSNLLSGLMAEAGANGEIPMNFNCVNSDAERILAEAEAVAEQKVNANFSDLPKGLSASLTKK